MRYFLLFSFAIVLGATFTACSGPKSSARMYEGDAPNIRYGESHAGGPMSTR